MKMGISWHLTGYHKIERKLQNQNDYYAWKSVFMRSMRRYSFRYISSNLAPFEFWVVLHIFMSWRNHNNNNNNNNINGQQLSSTYKNHFPKIAIRKAAVWGKTSLWKWSPSHSVRVWNGFWIWFGLVIALRLLLLLSNDVAMSCNNKTKIGTDFKHIKRT